MNTVIQTGDRLSDRFLEAALPLYRNELEKLSAAGEVCFFGEATVPGTIPEDYAAVIVFYRREAWLQSPEHKQLSAGESYAALPMPVSLSALGETLLQLCTAGSARSHPPRLHLSDRDLTVRYSGREAKLTEKEYTLLSVLYEHRGQVVSRELLVETLWPDGTDGNGCEVYMTYLRRKLRPLLGDNVIGSVRGKGYMLRLP